MVKEDVICICIYIYIYRERERERERMRERERCNGEIHTRACTRTHNGILCSHQKPRNLAICNDVDGTRGYYAKRNKSIRERKLSYDLSDIRNLRGRVGSCESKEGKSKTRWDGLETNHKRDS